MLMSRAKKKDFSNSYGQVLGTVFFFRYNLYYSLVYSPFTSSSPLNRLLILSAYFNLPRLPIGFYCSVKLLSHLFHFVLSLKPTNPMPYVFNRYTSAFYLHPFNPSFESFFRAAWAFTSLTIPRCASFDSKRKSTVSFHSFLRYRFGRSAVSFSFFTHHKYNIPFPLEISF